MRTEQQSHNLKPGQSSKRATDAEQPFVVIVDDDEAIREALFELILSAGLRPIAFASTRELIGTDLLEAPGCLILDVRMPGTSGLDLQRQLAQSGNPKPIIFLTGHGDIPMTVEAMKAGAVDFLTKPVRDQTLLDAVTSAIEMDAQRRSHAVIVKRNIEHHETLTPESERSCEKWHAGDLTSKLLLTWGSVR